MNVKELTILSSLTTILVVQNILLSHIPYIQLTFFLIFLYGKILGIKKTAIIIFLFVLIINLILGFVIPIQLLIMYLGYMFGPVLLNTIFKKTNNPLYIAIICLFCSIIYILFLDFSWWLIYPSNINGLLIMLGQGLLFAIPVFISSFFSVLILFEPLRKVINDMYVIVQV